MIESTFYVDNNSTHYKSHWGDTMDKPKIMIVDDNNLILEITGDLFEEAGFHVVKRNSPLGTTAAVNQEKPDCILLDVNMPALSGDKIVGLLKGKRSGGMKILLHSDRGEEELQRLAMETGADGFVKKSGDKGVLVAKVRAAIAG